MARLPRPRSTLIAYLEAQPGVERIRPGYNPATWWAVVLGGLRCCSALPCFCQGVPAAGACAHPHTGCGPAASPGPPPYSEAGMAQSPAPPLPPLPTPSAADSSATSRAAPALRLCSNAALRRWISSAVFWSSWSSSFLRGVGKERVGRGAR